jgi:hypothetical protein
VEAAHVPWRPLGELFVARGLISENELETALAEQEATGRRLGEILVERGLVSGPDLTSALMDQLGVEISKEEGFGSGLWAEIKRRHRRVRDDTGDGGEPELELVGRPEQSHLRPVEPVPQPEDEADPEPEPEPFVLPPAAVLAPAPALAPEAQPMSDAQLDEALEVILLDYEPPAPIAEPQLAEPEFAVPEPPVLSYEPVPEPAPIVAAETDPEPQPDPPAAAPELTPVAEHDDPAALRAELDQARADLAHLQGMLADAMTALNALTAEAAARPSVG